LEQPKRPVGGAYGVFVAEKRPEYLKSLAGKPVSEVSKMAGEAWGKLSEKQKEPYQKQYEEKKAQFDKDMAAFLEAGGEKTKGVTALRSEKRKAKEGKKKKDANAPKKPAGGGYGVYLSENREAILKSLPAGANKITDVSKKAGEQWSKLSEAEQQPFKDKFAKKQEEYQLALEEYKKTLGEDAEEVEDGDDEEEAEDEEDSPKKSSKRKVQNEVLAEASPQKKARKMDASAVMDEAKKEGLNLKLQTMLDNPKISMKGAQVLLDALRKADGKVIAAKKLLA